MIWLFRDFLVVFSLRYLALAEFLPEKAVRHFVARQRKCVKTEPANNRYVNRRVKVRDCRSLTNIVAYLSPKIPSRVSSFAAQFTMLIMPGEEGAHKVPSVLLQKYFT